jgi:hypothetical protein
MQGEIKGCEGGSPAKELPVINEKGRKTAIIKV